MKESKVSEKATERLSMRWLPVVDARGRTHMEAIWIAPALRAHPTTHAA